MAASITILPDQAGRGAVSFAPASAVAAGCIASLFVALLVCRPFTTHRGLSLSTALAVLAYCAITVAAGSAVALLWSRFRALALPHPLLFCLTCGASWTWFAPAALLLRDNSLSALFAAAVAGAVLAQGLRLLAPPAIIRFAVDQPLPPAEEHELFADSLLTMPWDWYGLVVGLGVYAAFVALELNSLFVAAILSAECAFLAAHQLANPRCYLFEMATPHSHSAGRLVKATLPALVLSLIAMLIGQPRLSGGAAVTVNAANTGAAQKQPSRTNGSPVGLDGYESIVLWPEPPKKEIVAPIELPVSELAPRVKKPIVIRFTGAYWYFQPPETGLGAKPHVAHGSPLAVDIRSTDLLPVTMEAHQQLATPIRTARCGEIEVVVENGDNLPGRIAIAVQLSDSTALTASAIYLGQQPLVSGAQDRITQVFEPAEETLRFKVPARASLRSFDEITVIVVPEELRLRMGAKIAIQQFEIMPR